MSDANMKNLEATEIRDDLAKHIQEELNQNVYLCYQCVKCSSGCPLGEFFDWQPNQIMRAIQFGDLEIALKSQTPWLCASCHTCSTRCPQGLDISAIMEFLTREARAQGIKSAVVEVEHFNNGFLNEVKLWGRAYELGLIMEMKLRSGDLFTDLDLAAKMLKRNKISFFPHPTRIPKKVSRSDEAGNAIAYYPGCSLHSIAPEYHASTKAVCEALDLKLIEPKGWLCCGSSAAHKVDPDFALQLPMENLRLIEQMGFQEVTMPCAACFNRHKAAQFEVDHDGDKREKIEEKIMHQTKRPVTVNTLAKTILNRIGAEGIEKRVRKPLTGLKVVSYYGCLLTRPPEVTQAEHPENPTELDEVLKALGAEVVDWSYKTSCCGAAHSLTRPDIVLTLSKRLIDHAKEAGADMIAVACPLCHSNMDARQFQMDIEEPLPILYFTQLMAVAFGLPKKASALNKNLVDPRHIFDM